MKTPVDLPSLVRVATEAAREAANSLVPDRDRQVVIDLPRDVKIQADLTLHRVLSETLRRRTALPVVSEEDEASAAAVHGTEPFWVVDPLDGSLNFSRGIPLSCISIGLWTSEGPGLGVVFDFHRNELFSGAVGSGAFLNGKEITVSDVNRKENAILCTGFPVKADFSHEAVLQFVTEVRSYKKVRLLGSAALSLAYVASGRADMYLEKDIAIWDVAAGLALVKAAGGGVLWDFTARPNRLAVAAANRCLMESLRSDPAGVGRS